MNYKHTKTGIIYHPEKNDADRKALYSKIFNGIGNKKDKQPIMIDNANPCHYQIIDIFRKIKEWKHRDYSKTCDPEHTENYNGFRVEIRYSCTCHTFDDAKCGLKFFVITADNRYFTNSYLYQNQINACNDAYEAIDNGEIPE